VRFVVSIYRHLNKFLRTHS